jgi:hypothetical protein
MHGEYWYCPRNNKESKEDQSMKIWPLALGVGMAAGAVGVMMLPRQCTVRKAAYKAAEKVEDAFTTTMNDMMDKMEM